MRSGKLQRRFSNDNHISNYRSAIRWDQCFIRIGTVDDSEHQGVQEKMNRDEKTGRYTNNKNTWVEKNGCIYCYLDGEMLFYTDEKSVMNYSWGHYGKGYSATKIDGEIVAAHRYIAKPKEDDVVDHINRNKQDNRVCNLRNTDKSINAYNSKLSTKNTSGVKGVIFRKDTRKWQARIMKNQKTIYLGCYTTKEAAAKARQEAEREMYDKQ